MTPHSTKRRTIARLLSRNWGSATNDGKVRHSTASTSARCKLIAFSSRSGADAKNHVNGLPLGYKYHAFDYLVKPVRVADFRQTLNRLFYYSQSADSFFTIKINGNLERFRQNNILYFSSTARKVTMYTTDGQSIDFYAKLDEVMTRLGQNNFTSFFRTHQSYLVNRQHALRIENKNVVLDNDDMLPISKKYYDEVKSIF